MIKAIHIETIRRSINARSESYKEGYPEIQCCMSSYKGMKNRKKCLFHGDNKRIWFVGLWKIKHNK
jgi:hypothetical protein